ncbi:hypothetical protein EDC04DRAFT_2915068 [Pisolithus marmoratus]|nr:hypothetical protein EDC04DRAFT_2915068 [Pisolithus marmoratus]
MVKAPKPYNTKQLLQISAVGQALATLQEQIDALARNQKAKENRSRKAKEHGIAINSQDLIPRPKGCPGELFNHLKHGIHKLVNWKLDTSRTITWQKNKLLVEKVLFQAQMEYKIFRKYENAWPTWDLLAQYLRNSSQQERKAARKLDSEHRVKKHKAEAICANKEPVDPDSEDTSEINFDQLDSETDSPYEERNESLTEETEDEQMEPDSESDKDNNPVSVKNKSMNMRWPASQVHMRHSTTSKPQKSDKNRPLPWKQLCNEESEDEQSMEKTKANTLALKMQPKTAGGYVKMSTNVRQPPESELDEDEDETYHEPADNDGKLPPGDMILKTCPGMYCEDTIPEHTSDQLKTTLSTYVSIIKAKKTNVQLATEICALIKREQWRLEAMEEAIKWGWPVMTIDFKKIPNRVLELYDKVQLMVFDKEACNNTYLWSCFEADLEVDRYSIAQFAKMCQVPITSLIWQNSCSGYYSSKGTAIIMHTLLQVFPPSTSTDTFQPLSLWQYLCYVVVLHIVCQLILEDLGISTTINTYKIMLESSDAGELIHPEHDDDEELDLIKHKTTLALKQIRTWEDSMIHDAAKVLVALQYFNMPHADQSEAPPPHPKPCLKLKPPKEPSTLANQVASRDLVTLNKTMLQTGPQVPTKKPHAR